MAHAKQLERKGWYDGWIYANIIDTETNPFRDRVFDVLKPGAKVLDIGCGTGNFSIKMARRGFQVTGVDISGEMISVAKKRLMETRLPNLQFLHINGVYLPDELNEHYDAAILSFSIHEMAPPERLALIQSLKKVAREIIFLDYHIPTPSGFWGFSVWAIEFLAGGEHFRNFQDFAQRGGLDTLVAETGLTIQSEQINSKEIFRLVVCSPSSAE
ncbi:Methyltransferase type 11 [Chloroherpeton thalassium ATCC 35110]|uniref:Methyltransferase type 11 n=1 Tax=Chloroherpeton thalassium (strain ATCC 35110 / GB-78) TaxID=517418 RepID=B3QY97_CHLT3|nr:class I SAM-dependent methyltransferase [Chloroherpeton thalassium]ACF15063.1 Methyltransferase type 11 [Chloroherpeton thalassium ATCC 35110]